MSSPYLFQYCQKLVVLSEDLNKVLLAQRYGEQDFDGVYSFIGGKMEISDKSPIDGMKREKNEEIGEDAKLLVSDISIYNAFYEKKDGSMMILPHHICKFVGGDITINKDEYSGYKWVDITDLESFEPKIDTVLPVTMLAKRFVSTLESSDFKEI